jgi:phosphoserine phosphatase
LDLERVLTRAPHVNVAIITFGMEAIVRPMLRGSVWETVSIFATPISATLEYFSSGKLEIARGAFGDRALEKAMFITDSEDDLDLLMAVGYPVLIEPHVVLPSAHL